ncbi:gamma-glutamylcyclotransferase [Piscibacillus salipiscarius]|uniref:gamma-glutamylcyclotransferase n=1 Tax=Piscibacillus salipiscarius TaxID=299480 RepID=UPI0024363778|nr:gamma-glutamylcyclotransferase [Piscibacillus salipiscarius]
MGQLVFVYGTLRRYERNHHLLEDAKLVSQQAWTKGRLIDTGYDYPAMLLDNDDHVYGELYEVDHDVLKQIDKLEGYQGISETDHYQRTEQLVLSDLGEFKALLYYYPKEVQNTEEIPFGDWRLKKLLDQGTPHYFAYGSCMDHERIEKAGMLTQFKTLGLGLLPEHELRFTVRADDGGRADIVEMSGHQVEGIVYEITEQALKYLYNREGVI